MHELPRAFPGRQAALIVSSLEATATAATGSRRPQFHSLRVQLIERLTDDAVALTFDVPADLRPDYAFAPGQHVTVRCLAAGDDARRTYSLCSAPPTLRIAVKRIANGVFSAHALHRLQVGDEIDVMTPTGRFTTSVDPTRAKHRGAIVAGSGVTPVLSMIYATLEDEPLSRFSLVYGNSSARTAMFVDELADLKDRFADRLAVYHVLSREPQTSALLSGRLDHATIGALLDNVVEPDTIDEWFLCGPWPVVDAARDALHARGVPAEQVRHELFHMGPAAPVSAQTSEAGGDEAGSTAEVADVTVVLAGRSTSVQVPFDRDVLHAVMPLRSDVPFGCTNGMCGTCRARVVEGRVDMRQCYALDARDLDAGFVLTCQARPRSKTVQLDYDA